MEKADIHISDLIDMQNPVQVLDEVNHITQLIAPGFDFNPVKQVFENIKKLYHGEYPGYRKCNTRYHDLNHVTDAFIAFARLVHGASLSGKPISKVNICYGLIATLMHDTGYIQTSDDTEGTGAKYTQTHIQRSIDFTKKYFSKNGMPENVLRNCCDMLKCTGLNAKITEIDFQSSEIELMGKMLGTADMLGQMADRCYLEKLQYLYYEFKEANIQGYDSIRDLLKKTIGFYEFTKKRLSGELDDMTQYLPAHFNARFGINADLYQSAMEKNMDHLHYILSNFTTSYRSMLRRGGISKELEELGL